MTRLLLLALAPYFLLGSICAGEDPSSPFPPTPNWKSQMYLEPATREWYRNPDGSCVQCSIGIAGVHCNDRNAATLLWDTEYGPRERGGSWPARVANYCNRRKIQALQITGEPTVEYMRMAAKNGQFAAIGFTRQHFETLYGYDKERKRWLVCNNNSPQRIDEYTEEEFIRHHEESGRWCVILAKPSSEPPEITNWHLAIK